MLSYIENLVLACATLDSASKNERFSLHLACVVAIMTNILNEGEKNTIIHVNISLCDMHVSICVHTQTHSLTYSCYMGVRNCFICYKLAVSFSLSVFSEKWGH